MFMLLSIAMVLSDRENNIVDVNTFDLSDVLDIIPNISDAIEEINVVADLFIHPLRR